MEDEFRAERELMVRLQIEARGISDKRLLEAMRCVPRHLFLLEESRAYWDGPQPIGYGQTISQPYIVALMTDYLELKGGEKVLEIGTGSAYQAAILAEMAAEVYSIEIVPALYEQARRLVEELGYKNIHLRLSNGRDGWPEESPFDSIIATCSPDSVPHALKEQLAEGGRLCLPEGRFDDVQCLYLYRREAGEIKRRELDFVRFVPMIRS